MGLSGTSSLLFIFSVKRTPRSAKSEGFSAVPRLSPGTCSACSQKGFSADLLVSIVMMAVRWLSLNSGEIKERRVMSFSAVAPGPLCWSCTGGLFLACSGHSGSCHGCSGLQALPSAGENRGSLKLLVKPCKKMLLLWRCSDPDVFLGPDLLTVPSSPLEDIGYPE